jgi:transposase
MAENPSIESLIAHIKELENVILQLKEENAWLRAKLERYEHPKNSRNSSVPPSKDENRVQRNKSLRLKSGKKVGGQPGHEGTTLIMRDSPDKIEEHLPMYCNHCGKDLTATAEELIEKRQVIDIPVIKPVCVEHRVYGKKCSCGHVTTSPFPTGVRYPIQYGSGTEAMISYLHSRHYLPFHRIKELLHDIFGLPISEGGIHCLLKRFTKKALPFYDQIKGKILQASVIGTDETGAKVNGKKNWFWAWQNKKLTYIVHSTNRGIDTIKRVFAKGLHLAIINHDRWASHFHCVAQGHQLCTAHLLRDCNYIEEKYKSSWAIALKDLLMEALSLKKKLTQVDYYKTNETIELLEKKLNDLLHAAINPSHKEAFALQKNLLKHRNSILLFLYHPKVPPDNNGSERSIRNVKVKQKVSGQFKTEEGAIIYAINRSIIDTIIKSNQNILNGLTLIANFATD